MRFHGMIIAVIKFLYIITDVISGFGKLLGNAELMAKNGLYAKMYKAQAKWYQ